MSKLEDIFTAKWAINDIKKICSHYGNCKDCPLHDTQVCGYSIPTMWNASSMVKEKRD